MKQQDYEKMDGFYRRAEKRDARSNNVSREGGSMKKTSVFRMLKCELVDIICGGALALATALSVLFWGILSDVLFWKFLYPLLAVGGKFLIFLAILAGFVIWFRTGTHWRR